ncbi:MAG: class A beta-lactamase-related serine hydrolase [Pyrinomonadaceae bacterium]|nr:class A beta-lactamase-related serine hydrolase [Pyrinomonadaceae bacterium]
MKNFSFLLILVFFSCVNSFAQNIGKYEGVKVEPSDNLQKLVDSAASQTLAKFADKGFKAENLSITLIDLQNPNQLKSGNFRGEEKVYPASVCKLFYLVAIHQWMENGKVKITPEIQRAMKDMIVDSSNEATQFIVDVVTDTSSGSELSPKDLEKWAFKRNAVNRYFTSLDYQNINVCQKTFCEDAYGREQQFRGKDGINRNKLTTNATARLMSEIVLGKAVTPDRTKQMLELLKRDWEAKEGKSFDGDDQAHGFTGIALNDLKLSGTKLWSKAGWTSTTRHDVAYIETPSGLKFVLCVFTTNFANERNIIPTVAKIVLEELGKTN